MSAYIVEPQTINRILYRLMYDRDTYAKDVITRSTEFSCDNRGYASDLGQAMYNLNINAVSQRYSNCKNLDQLPGYFPDGEYLARFKFALHECGNMQAIKSLECWLYQCSEGDVPQKSKLFQAFERVLHSWQSRALDLIPEYKQAKWA